MLSRSHNQQPVAIAEEEEAEEEEVKERAEVLRRRSRRLHQLASVYRRLYWCLLEDLRAKHRDYCWHYGTNGNGAGGEHQHQHQHLLRPKCAFSGCKSKAMPLTAFCHSHILADPNQTLYKPCIFHIKSSPQQGQGQGPPVICAKPVLKAAHPSLCHAHYQRSHKAISQALRKAGLPSSSSSSSNKPLPKFSLLISQAVRHVQMKRKSQSQSQSQPANCSKDDKTQEEQDLA